MMEDKTTYGQSLMHMVKGNLGTGVLAMPASFAHAGLINATLGLPILCLIATYCVHLLVDSSRYIESKTRGLNVEYASLAKQAFKTGPAWMRPFSRSMYRLVVATLLVAQMGVCCVYLVFITENIESILDSFKIKVHKSYLFLAILPVMLSLSYIRTLTRLAIASTLANVLEASGIVLILQYLLRGLHEIDLSERIKLKPLSSVALGFGSAMFAFEGIGVVLPVYARLKNPLRMSNYGGVINVAYTILLTLYFVVGMAGFLRFGDHSEDSITLNLPSEPLYEAVRVMFTMAVVLTYPLQFYVANEIVWNWLRRKMLGLKAIGPTSREENSNPKSSDTLESLESNVWASASGGESVKSNMRVDHGLESCQTGSTVDQQPHRLLKYEYACRTAMVMLTFLVAISVPQLSLLMGLIGSVTGSLLSFVLPALINLTTFWDVQEGSSRIMTIMIDIFIILFGMIAGICGATSSMGAILSSFGW